VINGQTGVQPGVTIGEAGGRAKYLHTPRLAARVWWEGRRRQLMLARRWTDICRLQRAQRAFAHRRARPARNVTLRAGAAAPRRARVITSAMQAL